MLCHILPNGSAGMKPLTCTIFDPTDFSGILRTHVFHISLTKLKFSTIGTNLNFGLKIAHRGATQALTGVR